MPAEREWRSRLLDRAWPKTRLTHVVVPPLVRRLVVSQKLVRHNAKVKRFGDSRHRTGASLNLEGNTVRDQSVFIGLALESIAEVGVGDGDERFGTLRY